MSNPCPECDRRERNYPPSPMCDEPCEAWWENATDQEWPCRGDHNGTNDHYDPDRPLSGYALRDDYLAGHPAWEWPPR